MGEKIKDYRKIGTGSGGLTAKRGDLRVRGGKRDRKRGNRK